MKILKRGSIVVGWFVCFMLGFVSMQAQTLTYYEYWLDDQIIARTAQPLNRTGTEAIILDSLNVNDLSEGIHLLNIRFKNDSLWSSVVSSYFYKTASNVQTGDILCEYWLDDSIAMRQIRPLQTSVSGGDIIVLDSLNMSGLSNGLHVFNIRFLDGVGQSSVVSSYFYKTASSVQTGDILCEYWLDDSIAMRQIRPLQTSVSGGDIIVLDSLNMSGLSNGLHVFNIRFLDGVGQSSVTSSYFYKTNTAEGVMLYEYWLDDSIATRQTKTINTLTANEDIVLLDSLNMSSLPNGLHVFNIRFLDGLGRSSVQSQYFYKLAASASAGDLLCEYWFDGNLANRKSQALTSTESIVFIDSVDVQTLCRGQHTLQTRFLGENGWSSVVQDTFVKTTGVRAMPYADFSFRFDENSYTAYFADSSLNRVSHRWNFGDGNFDSVQINPAHQYAQAGIYNVCLRVGNPNTYPCQVDSICQTVGIRGLRSISPNLSANKGLAIVQIKGYGFSNNTKVQLVRDTNIITGDSVKLLDISTLYCQFKFRRNIVGRYHLRVIVENRDTFILNEAFTLEEATPSLITDIKIIGPSAILPNREFNYRIALTNQSNYTAFALPLVIKIPQDKIARLITNVDTMDAVRYMQDSFPNNSRFYTFKDSLGRPVFNYASLIIPYLEPNETRFVDFKIKSIAMTPLSIEAGLGESLLDSTVSNAIGINFKNDEQMNHNSKISSCVQLGVQMAGGTLSPCAEASIGFATDVIGLLPIVNPWVGFALGSLDIGCHAVNVYRKEKNQREAKDVIDYVDKIATTAVSHPRVPSPFDKTKVGNVGGILASYTVNKLHWTYSFYNVEADCIGSPKMDFKQNISVVNSFDPNLKEGPKGINALNCVSGNNLMPYRIYFENADSATAPASEVYVYDTLDLTKFNLSNFRFTEYGFGNQVYYLNTPAKSFVRDIDLRPRKNIILRVSGDIDSLGQIQWSFKSFDPHTMDLTQNIDDGFLPPNRNKPEGEGYVGYSIGLIPNLPHETTIRNKADIVFDANPAIRTPYWTNTVDRVAPTSRVISITPTLRDSVFMVRWVGNDAHAGILDYTIYVSENNSTFRPWIYGLNADSALFTGKRGFQYAFYSIARDYVGNVETKNPTAEVISGRVGTTEIVKTNDWLGQNRPNPAAQETQIDFYLAAPSSNVRMDLYNVAGIKVKTVLNDALPAGLHTINIDLTSLSTGVYFYCLKTDVFSKTERMLIVK